MSMRQVCKHRDCESPASHGPKDSKRREFCARHAVEGMVEVPSPMRCTREGCSSTQASNGAEGTAMVGLCALHASEGNERIVNAVKKSDRNGCLAEATFGANGGGKAKVFSRHATDDEGVAPVLERRSAGARDGFVEQPAAAQGESGGGGGGVGGGGGDGGSTSREFCFQHAAQGEVVRVPGNGEISARDGCATMAPLGVKGGVVKQEYRGRHAGINRKGPASPNVKRCCRVGCPNTACFRVAWGKGAEFCSSHAGKGMSRVLKSRCYRDGCITYPTFGLPGSRRPSFCAKHALEGMVDVANKRCAGEGCSKHPSFGVEGSRKVQYCSQHAEPGMVNVLKRRCTHEGCSKQAMYGVDGTKMRVSLCTQHARETGVTVETVARPPDEAGGRVGTVGGGTAGSSGDVDGPCGRGRKRRYPPAALAPLETSSGIDGEGGKRPLKAAATPTVGVGIVEEISVLSPFMGFRRRRGVRWSVAGSTSVA